MKQEQDYIQDIAAIRSMMERSSKFLSLSGWSGVLAGVYALIGSAFVHFILRIDTNEYAYSEKETGYMVLTGGVVLLLAVSTAIMFSIRKAAKRNENIWNPIAKKMLVSMAVPLATGGILMLLVLRIGILGLLPCLSMIFYGLALFSAGVYTFSEIRILGAIQIGLGLLGLCLPDYGILLWAIGFGVMHIIYGAYIHFKYER